MTVQFTVDEKGNAQDILMTTTWGDQFLREITRSLKSAEELPPTNTPLYIHMKVDIAPNRSSYEYHIKITEEKFFCITHYPLPITHYPLPIFITHASPA